VWWRDGRPGVPWDEDIVSAVVAATVIVLLVSHASSQSEEVRREIALAEKRGKRILAFTIGPFDRDVVSGWMEYRFSGVQIPEWSVDRLPSILEPDSAPHGLIPSPAITAPPQPAPLDRICSRLADRYRSIAERYTPLEVRQDLRVCQWEAWHVARKVSTDDARARDLPARLSYDLMDILGDRERLVILGEPGSGKSTSLHAAAFRLAEARMRERTGRVPIVLSLNRYRCAADQNAGDALIAIIHRECERALQPDEATFPLKAVEAELRRGTFHLLLDGLNEVPAAHRRRCLEAIMTISEDHEACGMTVTSRKYLYNGEIPWVTVEVIELRRSDIETFVDRHAVDDGRTSRVILQQASGSRCSLFLNPLALRMMTQVVLDTGDVPSNRPILVGMYVGRVLDDYLAGRARAGVSSPSREDIERALAALARSMAPDGVCIPTSAAQQELSAHSDGSGPIALLESGLESGLLLEDDGFVRFWHQSISEYYHVVAFRDGWTTMDPTGAGARRYLREHLKDPAKWEALSMAAGLMSGRELRVFLDACLRIDEYLAAMAIANCATDEPVEALERRLLDRCARLATITFWLGSVVEWNGIVEAVSPLVVLSAIAAWFAQVAWGLEDAILLAAGFLMVAAIVRRVSDYLIFGRLGTLVHSLQHLGTPKALSSLLDIWYRFSRSPYIELSYLQVVQRVVVAESCSQDELMGSLHSPEERLYAVTALGDVADESMALVVCNEVAQSEDDHFVQAGFECIVSAASRYPRLLAAPAYLDAMVAVTQHRGVPMDVRQRAYSEAIRTGTTKRPRHPPTEEREQRLLSRLVSPGPFTTVLIVIATALAGLVVFPALASQLAWPFRNVSSNREIALRVGVIGIMNIGLLLLVVAFTRLDSGLRRIVQVPIERQWLALGGMPIPPPPRVSPWDLDYALSLLSHGPDRSEWTGDVDAGAMMRAVSYGLRGGFSVVRAGDDRVTLSVALRGSADKAQASTFFRFIERCYRFVFWALVVAYVFYQLELLFPVVVVWGIVNVAYIVSWVRTRPILVVTIERDGSTFRIAGDVRMGAYRGVNLERVPKAKNLMASVVAIVGRPSLAEPDPVSDDAPIGQTAS
jgi:hypothetical protein